MDFALPPVGEGLIEVELVRWMVEPGTAVTRGQSLMEVMSDKATMEVTADFAGTVGETIAEPGSKVQVGQLVMTFTTAGEPVEAAPSPAKPMQIRGELSGLLNAGNGKTATQPVPAPAKAATATTLPAAAPSVRYLARKLGLELAAIRGSGPAGRILHDDLAAHLQAHAPKNGKPEPTPRAAYDLGKAGTRMKLAGLRRKIAEHMVASSTAIPHYSYVDECDLTDLVRVRLQLKVAFAAAGVKLTFLPFMVKAVARALKEVPMVNATFDGEAGEATLHDRYNVGIAVATPTGLIVPVLKDADKKDVAAIATEVERLGADARAGKTKLDDLKGGTFTVTSVGNVGGLISTPIINAPEVGIMGVGRVVPRPAFDDRGNVVKAEMVYLSFSFDHRLVDGAVGATFANAVIRHLKAPATLLLPDGFSG